MCYRQSGKFGLTGRSRCNTTSFPIFLGCSGPRSQPQERNAAPSMRSLRLTFSVLVLVNAASLSAVLFSTVSLAQPAVSRPPTVDNATVPDNSLGNLPRSDSARTRTADNSKLPVATELVTGSERRNESGLVAMDSTPFVFFLFPLVENSSGIVPVSMVVGDVDRDGSRT